MTLAVLAVALAFRLLAPASFVTWDEPTWTYRSLCFLRALQTGHLAATYQSAHPGVLTMWAGAAAATARAAATDRGDWSWIDRLPAFDEDDVHLLATLAPWWPPGRAAVGVLTALLVTAAFVLLTRLLPTTAAATAGLLLAIDPYLLAHSRVLHVDAVLALCMLLSVLALLVHLRAGGHQTVAAPGGANPWRALLRRQAPALASGAAAGLALAEKSPAAALAPLTVLLVAWWALETGGSRLRAARLAAGTLAAWFGAAALAYCAVWPAMWVAPLAVAGRMLAYALQSAGGAREAVFFAGRVTPDPGALFYPVALAFRLSPLAVLGLLGSAAAWRRLTPATRRVLAGLLLLALGYAAFMAAGDKKFERYVLPAVPPLDVLAGVGLAWVANRAAGLLPVVRSPSLAGAGRAAASQWMAPGLLVAVLGLQAAHVASRAPYYLAYYSPLVGGGRQAERWLPVGWGEGMDLVAGRLDSAADPGTVATPSVALLAPLTRARVVPVADLRSADTVVLYVDDVQIGRPALVADVQASAVPREVVRLFGADYAWIYDARNVP